MVEQKPSEEVMRRVVPSEDLEVGISGGGWNEDYKGGELAYQVRSVKVAK